MGRVKATPIHFSAKAARRGSQSQAAQSGQPGKVKQWSEEKATAEVSVVKSGKKAGKLGKDYELSRQVSCPSKVSAKGRLRRGSADLPSL